VSQLQSKNASISPSADSGKEPLRLVEAVGATAVIAAAALGVAVAFGFAIAGAYAGEKFCRLGGFLRRKGGRHVQ